MVRKEGSDFFFFQSVFPLIFKPSLLSKKVIIRF